MPRPKPACEQTRSFLRAHHIHLLASLTGQDSRALAAFAHLLDLYAASDDRGRKASRAAMTAVLCAMQPSVREAAKRAIASQLDWGDEVTLWPQIDPAEPGACGMASGAALPRSDP